MKMKLFSRSKKKQTQDLTKEIPTMELTGITLDPAIEVDGITFFALPLDQWMKTSRFIGAVQYLKCRELFNLTPDQFMEYDNKLDELMEKLVEQINIIAVEKSAKLLAKRMPALQATISHIKLHRENLKFAMTLLDVPEIYYWVGVHALFLPGDDPSQMLNFEEQERRVKILKKKGWISLASLSIIRVSLELPNSYFQTSIDAFEQMTKTHRAIREGLGILEKMNKDIPP